MEEEQKRRKNLFKKKGNPTGLLLLLCICIQYKSISNGYGDEIEN